LASEVWLTVDASMVSQIRATEHDNCGLKRMYANLRVQADFFNCEGERHLFERTSAGPSKKAVCPSLRREVTENAGTRQAPSIALACRMFGVSETFYRHGLKLRACNEEMANLLTG